MVQYWIEPEEIEGVGNGPLSGILPPDVLALLLEGLKKSVDDVPRALAQGARVLISPTSRLYFDRMHTDASTDPAQKEARGRLGLQFAEPASIRRGVDRDPVEDTPVECEAQIAGSGGGAYEVLMAWLMAGRVPVNFTPSPTIGVTAPDAATENRPVGPPTTL